MNYRDFITDPSRRCAITAHRGAWHGAPENSLAAIENAIRIGATIAEIDVRKSADGELFLLHDDTLLRMAGLDRDPETMTLAELQALTLREDDGGEQRPMTDQRVPTLKEALDLMRGRIFADLDLKDRGLFGEVAACVREMQAADGVDLKTAVMTPADVQWVREQGIDGVPFMAMGLFTAADAAERIRLMAELSPFMCEVHFDTLETIAQSRAAFAETGMAMWVNTLNQEGSGAWRDDVALADPDAIWGKLLDAGFTIIQTDEPAALKAYLDGRSG